MTVQDCTISTCPRQRGGLLCKWVGGALLGATLAGCATVPAPLQGQFAATTPRDAAVNAGQGESVRWGGEIINVDPRADKTCFEILARDLDASARPVARDPSNGRFIACRDGFYDPEEFKRGRDLTVVGRLDGTEHGKVGEFDYTYPRVAADAIYLWPKRPLYVASPYYYDPWLGPWWGYGPYWGGPWWGPTVIVEHPRHPPPPPPSK
jgi:outer membrane lipoprotein